MKKAGVYLKKVVCSKAFTAFAAGYFLYIVIMLPDIISGGGIITYSGDYSLQSIPFTYHIKDALQNGEVYWDGYSGLGGQFFAGYAYYNLFSPFSFIYLIIPRGAIIYAMPYVTALKYACGTLFAYCFIKRFVSNGHYAVIGGLLYMYSTFTAYNQIFHFTDSIALFPLLLIALDELCVNRRRCFFALAVLLTALTNYYFFFGQAIFCVLYFFTRTSGGARKRTRIFFHALTEGLLGTAAAAFVLLPAALQLLCSAKATSLMNVSDMLVYDSVFYYLKIMQSVFMLPDPFNFVSLFPAQSEGYPFGTLGASVAAYIPMFSAAGVISYMVSRKKSRFKILIVLCCIIALVPFLNQLFSALNTGYYARWYYMPLIIGVLLSVKALEEQISFKPGIAVCAAAVAAMLIWQAAADCDTLITRLAPHAQKSLPQNILHFAVTVICLIILIIVVKTKRNKEFIPKLYIFTLISVYMCNGVMTQYTVSNTPDKQQLIESYCFDTPLPDNIDTSLRTALNDGCDNMNLIWQIPSTSFFNSVKDIGYAEFTACNSLEASSGLSTDIGIKTGELADLCSVKYFFAANLKSEYVHDVSDIGSFGPYRIYENDNYIPMGFTYDRVISAGAREKADDKTQKRRLYMKALVADDPSVFSDILTVDDSIVNEEITDEEYRQLIAQRKSRCCYALTQTADGITSRIDLPAENIVFYSVSYNDGWSAYTDGNKAELYKVNNGLVGVRVPKGDHEVRLVYTVKGLSAGTAISAIGAVGIVILIVTEAVRAIRNGIKSAVFQIVYNILKNKNNDNGS